MLLGVHCSISGGIENAITEAAGLKINALQIFTKNQRTWKEKEYTEAEGNAFKKSMSDNLMKVCFSHTTYLLNLASSDDDLRNKSIKGLAAELMRCHILGLPYAVLHPGSNKLVSKDEAISIIAKSLNKVIELTGTIDTKVLLENTAGQGSTIGGEFEHLGNIMDQVEKKERLGVCFDTCHAFAAGHDIRTKDSFEDTMARLDKAVNLDNLLAFHLNDSKGDLGKHLDRHEHIGQGLIGPEPFRQIINRFPNKPKVLETSKKEDWDAKNIAFLRSLVD
jgi:deoxyribonuclease IV